MSWIGTVLIELYESVIAPLSSVVTVVSLCCFIFIFILY
jgi:hypothetical protein